MEEFNKTFFESLFSWNNLKWLLVILSVVIIGTVIKILLTKFERKVDDTIDNHLVGKNICPKCGGKLRKRHGKYGDFLGCSNYPKCRYTTGEPHQKEKRHD